MSAPDFLVVGAGMFGAVVAQQLATAGASVLISEQAATVGGLCASTPHPVTGEQYCPYGTHVLATSDERVWRYVTALTPFTAYQHTVYANAGGRTVPMPIGLAAIRACYGDDVNARRARELVTADTAAYRERPIATVRDAALAAFGPRLYEMFVRGYVTKQWSSDPAELTAEVLTDRFTIRYDDEGGYHGRVRWQGLPTAGYGELFTRLLSGPGIDVVTGRRMFPGQGGFRRGVVHTGPIDAFFAYRLGRLDRRRIHLRWRVEDLDHGQATAVMVHPDPAVPYYRSHRPRHLPWNTTARRTAAGGLVGYEYPGGPPADRAEDIMSISFVVRSPANAALAAQYRRLAQNVPGYVLAGRGTTFYDNMGTTVSTALDLAARLICRHGLTPVEAR